MVSGKNSLYTKSKHRQFVKSDQDKEFSLSCYVLTKKKKDN